MLFIQMAFNRKSSAFALDIQFNSSVKFNTQSPKPLGRNGICLCLVNAQVTISPQYEMFHRAESSVLTQQAWSDTAAVQSANGPSPSRLRKWHVWRTSSKTNDNIIWKHVENGSCGQSSAVGEMEHYTTVYLFSAFLHRALALGCAKTKLGHPTSGDCSTLRLPFHPNVHFSHEGRGK